MASVSSKLSLKSTTRLSLNERFKMLRQKATQNAAASSQVRQQMQTQRQQQQQRKLLQAQGSAQNRRLALQMANRPTVQAALKLKMKSIQQRLGNRPQGPGNQLRKRLGGKFGRNQLIASTLVGNRGAAGAGKRTKLNRGNFAGVKRAAVVARFGNRIGARLQSSQGLVSNRNMQFVAKKRVGGNFRSDQILQRQQQLINQRNQIQNRVVNQKMQFKGRKNLQQAQGQKKKMVNQRFKNNRRNQPKQKGAGKGFAAKGKAGGKGWQRNKKQPKANREQLDNDLDAYMAKTRTHLDADLDTYMAETNI